jgi:integrase
MTTDEIRAAIALLAETFPKCFAVWEQRRQPLKVGVHKDVLARLDGAMTPVELANALRAYVANPVYRRQLLARRLALRPRRYWSSSDYVIASERGGRMRPLSIVVWFNRAFKNIGLKGCSSHSGRRTFVTRAARIVHKAGGSLRDVQLLAGHRSIQTTQRYIDGDTDAQRKLVAMI